MPSSFFFMRLIPNRPNFAASMTAEEQSVMRAHVEFLQGQLAAGKLVAAGPVIDPSGVFGMCVVEAESIDEVRSTFERDPAKAIGRYDIFPMASAIVRPARPSGA